MTEHEARALQTRIPQEMPLVQVQPGTAKFRRTAHTLRLTHTREQRVLTIHQSEQWESVKQAWGELE